LEFVVLVWLRLIIAVLKYAKETYKAVKPGGKKFSALTQRVETVINLLIEVGGI